jgi:hypothetical protein
VQGRALLNAVGNLELKDAYTAALHKLGHELEAVAEQVLEFFCSLVHFVFEICIMVQMNASLHL